MRFTSVLIAGALAVAARAQSTTESSLPSTTVSIDPVQSSVIACLAKCDDDDVGCRADCSPIPSPNEDDANKTTECAADCDQGDGSPSDTQKFSDCVQKCINDYFFQDGEGTPNGDGSSSGVVTTTATATDAATVTTGTETVTDAPETTGTESDSATESGATATNSNEENQASNTSDGASPSATDDDSGATALFGSALAGVVALALAL